MQDPKNRQNATFGHHCTTLSGYIFATKACINNQKKKLVKQQWLPRMSSEYGVLRTTSGWDLLASLGHPSTFQRVLSLGSVTAPHSSSGHQPNFAALNRGRHLYLAGRPSRWALADILVPHELCWSLHITRVVSLSYLSAITNTTSVTMWQSNLKFRHGEWQETKLGRLCWNGMWLDRNWTRWAAGFWDGPVFQSLWTTSQPWCYIRDHIITEGMITAEHATVQADNQLLHKCITDVTMNYFANHQLPHHKQDVGITDSIKCYMIWSEWVTY